MKKVIYKVGTKKTCSYAEALEYARRLRRTIHTHLEVIELPTNMTEKQRENRVKVGAKR